MSCGHSPLVFVVAVAALAAVARATERRKTERGEFPYVALASTMWGECSAAILSPLVVLGPASCLPAGYPKNGRVEAGNNKFKTTDDFNEEPSQGRIVAKFIKHHPEDEDADSVMIMELLEPFTFSTFVNSVPMTKKSRVRTARVLVVGYGMGGSKSDSRVQTATELQVGACGAGAELLCVEEEVGCRPDHGAPAVESGQLLAIASLKPLCNRTLLFLGPYRKWIRQQLHRIENSSPRSTRHDSPRKHFDDDSKRSSIGATLTPTPVSTRSRGPVAMAFLTVMLTLC